MKNSILIQSLLSIGLTLGLTGCLSDGGTTEEPSVGTPTTTPPDFEVEGPGGEQGGLDTGDEGTQIEHPPVVVNPNMDFIINNGESHTKQTELMLTMFAPGNTFDMKIGSSANCTDGQWERYLDQTVRPIAGENALTTVSVQFRSDERVESDCMVKSIYHDSLGPQILVKRFPSSSIEEGTAPEIEYEVTDPAGLGAVNCSLNGVSKACSGGNQTVKFTPLPEGDYSFVVTAKDSLGNETSATVEWSVVSTTKKLNQYITVNDYKKVDILINIDNSGSMEYEQKNMAQRVSRFIEILRGLDYQIAVTTTDPRDVTLGDGRLIPLYGTNGEYILNSSVPEDVAQYRLGMTLQRPETGGASEQAIFTSTRVIERSLSGSSAHRSFIRDGAQLAVVVISDEDESASEAKNNPENLTKLIHDSFGGQKTFTWHSIITRPGDTQCKSTYGATYGQRYADFSTLTGGLIGSVCEADYGNQVSDIANGIRNMLKTLTLQCKPLAQFPIEVFKDGQPYAGNFTVSGINLNFSSELQPGSYEVEYRCLK